MPDQPAVYYCRICGEAIFSVGTPSRCPACGAWPRWIVVPDGHVGALGRDMDAPKALQARGIQAIQQEVDTAEVYSRIAAHAHLPLMRESFRALQRIESRHAGLLATAFRIKRPRSLEDPDFSSIGDGPMLDVVRARENATIALYGDLEILGEGGEFSSIFQALMEIEADHNVLADALRGVVQG